MIEILIVLVIVAYALYKLSIRNFDYWKKRGVPYIEPSPVFGNLFEVFSFRTTLGHLLGKFYKKIDTPYFGIFILNRPYLIIKDPILIKTLLVKDFNYFCDRSVVSDEKHDSLIAKAMFFVKSPEWKIVRTKMSPVFTTGKIKNMLALINNAAEDMTNYLGRNTAKRSIEAKEVCAKYSTDVIASCAFGIKANCFENENAEFRTVGRKIFEFTPLNAFRQTCYFVAPTLVKLFGIAFIDPSCSNFLRDVFWKTIQERENGDYKRNDLIDIIVQMRKQAVSEDGFEFEGDRVVAQAAQFYGAGFETVSSTLSFTLYELCLHPEMQSKLRSEINSLVLKQGEFTYESIQEMKYMHMVVCETLRKYPAVPFLDRICVEDYQLPGSNLTIEKGTPVYVPMFGLLYDEKYFPDPENYDPERFSEKNKSTFPPFTYLPFGDGPRTCIGERFALMVVKLGLAHILSGYEVERTSDTPVPIVYETKSLLIASKVGLPMKFRKLFSEAA